MIRVSCEPFVRNVVSSDGPSAVVPVVNEFDERSVEKLRKQVDRALNMGQPFIPIIVDSFGGDICGVLAMLDTLNAARSHAKIATVATGKAMSAGLILLSCGADKGLRFVGPNASMMLHDGSAGTGGKVHDMQTDVDVLKGLNERLLSLLDKSAGKKPGHFSKVLHGRDRTDLHMTAQECVDLGLADHVGVPTFSLYVSCDFEVTLSGQVPLAKKRRSKK